MRIFILFFSFCIGAWSLNAQSTTVYGYYSGTDNVPGDACHFGFDVGGMSTGGGNAFFGAYSGHDNTTGGSNTFMGRSAGSGNIDGSHNAFLGFACGAGNISGSYNTMLGRSAGRNNVSGSENVFVGYRAGYNETGSGKLYIDNSGTSSPLIYGDFYNDELIFNGNVGIGITSPQAKLDVNGSVRIGNVSIPNNNYKLYVEKGILTEKVIVATHNTTEWADYVFEEDYDRNTTEEVEAFIKCNKHLPNVPSAEDVNKKGVNMVEMDAALLRQIEELWLHVIELKKENVELKEELEAIKK